MGVCMRGGESDRDPPAVVAIVCVVAGEREKQQQPFVKTTRQAQLRQNHSTSTAHQSIDTRNKTLSQQYPSEKIIGVGWIHQT